MQLQDSENNGYIDINDAKITSQEEKRDSWMKSDPQHKRISSISNLDKNSNYETEGAKTERKVGKTTKMGAINQLMDTDRVSEQDSISGQLNLSKIAQNKMVKNK